MNPTKLESKTANRLGKKAHEYNGVYTRLDSYGHDTNLNFKQSTHKNRNTVRLGGFFFFFLPAGNLWRWNNGGGAMEKEKEREKRRESERELDLKFC